LVWAPVTLLLGGSAWLDIWRVSLWLKGTEVGWAAVTAWLLWWFAILLLAVYLWVGLLWPQRGPHDRLSGVYPMPR
jgi:hypothetical protein